MILFEVGNSYILPQNCPQSWKLLYFASKLPPKLETPIFCLKTAPKVGNSYILPQNCPKNYISCKKIL